MPNEGVIFYNKESRKNLEFVKAITKFSDNMH